MGVLRKKPDLIKQQIGEMGYLGDYSFTVTELEWERVFLRFVVETDYPGVPSFALKSLTTRELVPLSWEWHDGDRYGFSVNITAAKGRSFLDNGRWVVAFELTEDMKVPSFVLEAPEEHYRYQQCYVDADLAYSLEDQTRIFRYGGNKFAYTVNFTIASRDDVHLEMRMVAYFMEKNEKWNRRRYVHEAMSWRRKLAKVWYAFAVMSMNLVYRVVGIGCPKNGKNIMIMSETGDELVGNLRAIDDRLRERGLDKTLHITRSARRSVGETKSVFSWAKLIVKIARQNVIIVDNYVPVFSFLELRKDVQLIQVWHAGGGFKAVGYCRFGKSGSPYPAGSCHKAYTTALCGAPHLIPVFEEVFGIEGKDILPIGMPRLDGYLDPERIEEFRKAFYSDHPELLGKKIILFAPTYRGVGQKTAHYDQDKIDLAQIYEACGDEYVFLIKLHPFILERFEIPEKLKDRIYDFSDFASINDLFYVTDLLITDYSSNFYEFSLMRKPMLFYTYDRSVYELTRGVYRWVKDSAPGKVCDSFEELVEAIKTKDFEFEKVDRFVEDNFAGVEGGASDLLIDEVILRGRN